MMHARSFLPGICYQASVHQATLRQALLVLALLLASFTTAPRVASAQSLQAKLIAEGTASLAEAALRDGDAARGAVVFHQPTLACARCHSVSGLLPEEQLEAIRDGVPGVGAVPLGPNLTELPADSTDEHLVESILAPSAKIRQGFESITVETSDGEIFAGLPVDETAELLRLRHPLSGAIREFPTETIEARSRSPQSAMPEGQADQLTSRQQFLDLVRYLIEIRDGGAERARQLQPPASMFVLQLPEYEAQVDHAGLIRALDDEAFRRGEAIYQRLCINCHGDRQQPGSLPTAPRFATSELRNGADPYSMYRTLTHGFGFMVPQTWMVPRQKYDVIHYIRMAYFADRSEPYAMSITDEYLASLPAGNTLGPEPIESRPWVDMDYGPSLINTYEIPTLSDADVSPHLAYKGIAVRLDPGPGGVSRGSAWALYDHDLMSLAAAWTYDPETPNERFIDWYGIHFDGRHGAHPSLDGDVQLTSGGMPGWAAPDGSWRDESRVVGRDGRRYGPLPQDWAKYRGIYHSGDRTILSYSIGETAVLESPSLLSSEVASASQTFSSETLDQDGSTTFLRTLHIGPRSEPLQLLVAVHPDRMPILTLDGNTALVARATEAAEEITAEPGTFDGNTWIEVTPKRRQLDMNRDFTLVASLRTEEGGTIFCRTAPESDWVPDGKTFFVRDGRLNYDIGWVGCVTSDRRVDDGQWHEVALSWEAESQQVRFMIDGKPAGEGNLKPQGLDREEVIRLGMTAQNFPQSGSGWNGDLKGIAFYQTALSDEHLAGLAKARRAARQNNQTRVLTDDASIDASLEAAWLLEDWNTAEPIAELREQLPGEVVRRFGRQNSAAEPLMATVIGAPQQAGWSLIGADARGLALQLPAGEEPLSLVIAVRRGQADEITASAIASLTPIDLTTRLTGQGSRWPEVLTTTSVLGDENGPFAVDVLAHPERNPWLAQMRFSGLDFLEDGDSMVVTSWDGDVWKVSGLREGIDPQTRTLKLTWRRIVSGLFQPLGVKVVDGTIYVSCRDQLAILRDADGDGEAEFVECFNSDHQVTEHFHEFAMGLQRDAAGNWYYAKSARHALTAVVPHHGTLLRVSPDGSRTDIVATGFRAANGVCLNPDGTFIVTDQEGHWNPKNRINWVREGGFYGNMFGYHDQTDASDAAMEQPLCWITNAFDRSPAELLWVDSPAWGPLQGSLLNLSYGYGKVFVVPHENLNGQMQGAMCELPIPQFPTGVMRGRFRAEDGHLYLCGLFAWAGNQTQPGGLYRMRATGKPATVPIEVHASPGKLTLVSSDPLDRERAGNPLAYSMLAWSLRRSANYGSDHLDERKWQVTAAKVSEDGRTVELTIPDLQPTWCYELRCLWVDAQGTPAERVLHGTVHGLGE